MLMPRGDRDIAGIHKPAFCLARIFAATSSLARCCSDPVMVFLLFYKGRQKLVSHVEEIFAGAKKGLDRTT